MELVLMELTWNFCRQVCSDDIIIMDKNCDEDWSNLKEIFGRLRNAHLQLNAKKYLLLQEL